MLIQSLCTILYMDSSNEMSLAENLTHYKRSKHIDIKYNWLREHTYEEGTIHLEHCGTEDMVADVLTKALAFKSHVKHAVNISEVGDQLKEDL